MTLEYIGRYWQGVGETSLIQRDATPSAARLFAKAMVRVTDAVRDKLHDVQAALANRDDLRALFRSMFPEGLTFTPEWGRDATGRRKIWRASGKACFPLDQLDL